MCFTSLYSVFNTLLKYTYFSISRNILLTFCCFLHFFESLQSTNKLPNFYKNIPMSEKVIKIKLYYCVKSVRIRSFSGPYFLAFGLNTERYWVSLRILSECGKIRARKTTNTGTFHAVYVIEVNSQRCYTLHLTRLWIWGTDINRSSIKINQPLTILLSNIESLQVNSVALVVIALRKLIFAELIFALKAIEKRILWKLLLQVRCPKDILRSYFEWRITVNFENSPCIILSCSWQRIRVVLNLKTQLELTGVAHVI